MIETYEITIPGMVQGIGFRPFVAELAEDLGITGTVCNCGGIVTIVCEVRSTEVLEEFQRRLRFSHPQGAEVGEIRIASIDRKTAEAMGWEYVTKYRSFYIYRSFDPMARPLHTDPAVQALTIKYLRRQTWTNLFLDLLYAIVLLFLRRSYFGFIFKDLAMIGPVYVVCYLGLFLLFIIRPITHIYYLHKAIKQLRKGNSLDHKKLWKQNATFWICSKIVPLLL